jgi:hypothetical protein
MFSSPVHDQPKRFFTEYLKLMPDKHCVKLEYGKDMKQIAQYIYVLGPYCLLELQNEKRRLLTTGGVP